MIKLFKRLRHAWRLWRLRRSLGAHDRYVLELLLAVRSTKIWARAILLFQQQPSFRDYRLLMDGLERQHFENGYVMGDLVGLELALQLPAYRALKQERLRAELGRRGREALKIGERDILGLQRGDSFFVDYFDQEAFLVTDVTKVGVVYRKQDEPEHPLQVYPREQGHATVYVTLETLAHVRK